LNTGQAKLLDEITALEEKVSTLTNHYWRTFSNADTWQFWLLLALLVLPLVALYILIDRKKAFHLGFFGFNVHVWFHYIDIYGFTHGLWSYPYKVIPFLPSSVTLDTAFIPVIFMLVYQWTINNKKNYYIYLTGLCFFLSFLFKPTMVAFGLFQFYKGINYFHLLAGYITVMLISRAITNVFLYFQQHPKTEISNTKKPIEKEKPKRKRFILSRLFHFKRKAKN